MKETGDEQVTVRRLSHCGDGSSEGNVHSLRMRTGAHRTHFSLQTRSGSPSLSLSTWSALDALFSEVLPGSPPRTVSRQNEGKPMLSFCEGSYAGHSYEK